MPDQTTNPDVIRADDDRRVTRAILAVLEGDQDALAAVVADAAKAERMLQLMLGATERAARYAAAAYADPVTELRQHGGSAEL